MLTLLHSFLLLMCGMIKQILILLLTNFLQLLCICGQSKEHVLVAAMLLCRSTDHLFHNVDSYNKAVIVWIHITATVFSSIL